MPLSHLVRRTQVGFCGKIFYLSKIDQNVHWASFALHFSKLNSPTLVVCHYTDSSVLFPIRAFMHLDLDGEEIANLGEGHQPMHILGEL